jgi:hypothetical protein
MTGSTRSLLGRTLAERPIISEATATPQSIAHKKGGIKPPFP